VDARAARIHKAAIVVDTHIDNDAVGREIRGGRSLSQ